MKRKIVSNIDIFSPLNTVVFQNSNLRFTYVCVGICVLLIRLFAIEKSFHDNVIPLEIYDFKYRKLSFSTLSTDSQ